MKEPTLEDLRKEKAEYRAHLDSGKEPIQIITEIHPSDTGLDLKAKIRIPKELLHLIWTCEFADYITNQIRGAIQPPDK